MYTHGMHGGHGGGHGGGVCLVVEGPKEVPKMGRMLGKYVGMGVGKMQKMRRYVEDYAEKHDVQGVQEELEMTVKQLERIRAEVRSSVDVLGTFAAAGGGKGRKGREGREDGGGGAVGVGSNTSSSNTGSSNTGVGSNTSGENVKRREENMMVVVREEEGIPVSAKSAGLLPDREKEGGAPTGSELLFDCLKEEEVAKHASMFMKRGHGVVE